MPDKTTRSEKVTWASVALALITSLAGNGYFAQKSADAQTALVSKEDARVEAVKESTSLRLKQEALQQRYEDHVKMREATDRLTQDGLVGVRRELSGVKDTLIQIVQRLP